MVINSVKAGIQAYQRSRAQCACAVVVSDLSHGAYYMQDRMQRDLGRLAEMESLKKWDQLVEPLKKLAMYYVKRYANALMLVNTHWPYT